MIFPFFDGVIWARRAPITWMLIGLNVFVMVLGQLEGSSSEANYDELIKDKGFLEIQGSIYQSYLRDQLDHKITRTMASVMNDDAEKSLTTLGVLALRDQKFLDLKVTEIGYSDKVAVKYWKKKLDVFLVDQSRTIGHVLGLSTYSDSFGAWITYMFAHGSFTHLMSNMVFLLLIGAALEVRLGGLGVLIVYLMSGFIAAGVFILSSGLTAAPLVGASGAVSGLITLAAVLNWNRPVKFFYWYLLPTRKALGFVFLPGAFVFYLWIVADLAGFISSTSFTGGVAHAAHLGGHLAGFLAGVGLLLVQKKNPHHSNEISEPQMYRLTPIFRPLPPAQIHVSSYSR